MFFQRTQKHGTLFCNGRFFIPERSCSITPTANNQENRSKHGKLPVFS